MPLEPPSLRTSSPIQLHLAGDKAYVYDVQDIRRLRVDHHITGITLGTLPQVAQQNVFLGVPVQLLPEEVAVLVEERLAVLVNDADSHNIPSHGQATAYAQHRISTIRAQQELTLQLDEEKSRLMREKYKDQIEKTQKQKKEKRAAAAAAIAERQSIENEDKLNDSATSTTAVNASQQKQEEQDSALAAFASASLDEPNPSSAPKTSPKAVKPNKEAKDLSKVPYTIVNETTSSGRSWYRASALPSEENERVAEAADIFMFKPLRSGRSTFSNLDGDNHSISTEATKMMSQHQACLNEITKIGTGLPGSSSWADGSGIAFSTPRPDADSIKLKIARIKVFKDLWLQGYYMGSGLKFGGDFLVYPGDPLRFHSHFTCTVLASPIAEIGPLDIVAWGRLATAVKKAHLLASYNEKTGKVDYLSLEWAAFG